MRVHPWKNKLLLLLVSIAASLIIAEVILRIVAPLVMKNPASLWSENGHRYGWAPIPNSRLMLWDDEEQHSIPVRINNRGWKDVDQEFNKPPGVFRILFLGDSHTYAFTRIQDSYPRQVEAILRQRGFQNVEVICIGSVGWSTDQELEALQQEGLKYSPDLVICQFCDNDVVENLLPTEETPPNSISRYKPFRYILMGDTLQKVLLNPQIGWKLRCKHIVMNSALISNLWVTSEVLLLQLRGRKSSTLFDTRHNQMANRPEQIDSLLFAVNYVKGDSKPSEGTWKLTEALILKMSALCHQRNIQFAVFNESDAEKRKFFLRWRFFENDGQTDFITIAGQKLPLDFFLPRERLEQFCTKSQIPYMIPRRPYHRFDFDQHLNPSGNKNLALDLVDFLEAEKLITIPSK